MLMWLLGLLTQGDFYQVLGHAWEAWLEFRETRASCIL